LNDLHRVGICNLAENNVLAVEPRRNDCGDEELRAVTRVWSALLHAQSRLLTCLDQH